MRSKLSDRRSRWLGEKDATTLPIFPREGCAATGKRRPRKGSEIIIAANVGSAPSNAHKQELSMIGIRLLFNTI